MIIVETPVFTKRVLQALNDEQYRALQAALLASPDAGPVIPGGGGLRKLRWAGSGRGKRGGTRVIYRWFPEHERLLMLFVFLKQERGDLSASQLKQLRLIAEGELR
ncbi:MAG: type II toxin-antitoxin system RelE/ParE family toxin [Vicinamibacterales bacterium]